MAALWRPNGWGPGARGLRPRGILGSVVSIALVLSPPCLAQRDLSQEQPAEWYGLHVGLSTLGLLASFGLDQSLTQSPNPRWARPPAFEAPVQLNSSPLSGRTSDLLLATNLALSPLGLGIAAESAGEWANASLIDVEAVAASLLLSVAVKHAVRRARPWSLRASFGGPEPSASADAVLSFYSAHAALSATSAVAGGMLVSAVSPDLGLRSSFWGSQLALAALTAHLRVRAGMHYPSDVIVGGLVGATIGVLVPLGQQVRVELEPGEWAAMGVGVAVGTAAGFLFPNRVAEVVLRYPLRVELVEGGGYALLLSGRL